MGESDRLHSLAAYATVHNGEEVSFILDPVQKKYRRENGRLSRCPTSCYHPSLSPKSCLPSGIESHVYFLKCLLEGRSVVLVMRLHRPGQWFFLSPEELYFSSCDSVLLGGRYVPPRLTFKYPTIISLYRINWLVFITEI
jgi:hypothetical protein